MQRSTAPTVTRRTVLKMLGAGSLGLGLATSRTTAAHESRYILTTRGASVQARLERAGFTVSRTLADGRVLLVDGTDATGDPETVRGVTSAAADQRLEWHGASFRHDTDGRPTPESLTVDGNPPSADTDLRPDQWGKDRMDIDEAHETATGDGTTIAIVDSGIAADHPDLTTVDTAAGRQFKNGTIRSGTGEVTVPADAFDLCAGTETVTDQVTTDTVFHGTWVAGVAGASRTDETGSLGTAPDTTLLPLKINWWDEVRWDCDGDGDSETAAALFGTLGDILAAVDYAAKREVDAINLSLGTPPLPPQANRNGLRAAYRRVFAYATRQGAVVTAAAGNDGTSLQQGGFFMIPSSVAGAVSVSATGPNDRATFYTNSGTNAVDVGAPGGGYDTFEKTFCTGDGELFVPPFTPYDPCREDCECTPAAVPYPYNGVVAPIPEDSWLGRLLGGAQYYFSGGTSAAAPQVAGTAALVREHAPDTTARQIEQAVEHGADGVTGGGDPALGAGRVNAADTLDAPTVEPD